MIDHIPMIVTVIVLILLSVSDLKYKTVPLWLLIAYILSGVIFLVLFHRDNPVPYLYGGVVGMICMGVSKITREQIGMGDSYLFFGLGLWLGWEMLLHIILWGSLLLLLLGGISLLCRRATWKTTYPFIPFILIGNIVILAGRFFR